MKQIKVTIKGTSPLLMNRFNIENALKMQKSNDKSTDLFTYKYVFDEIRYGNGHFLGCVDRSLTENKENGFFRLVYDDGAIFEGINKNGFRYGWGRYIDKNGNIEMPFNSEGMYRAKKSEDGALFIKIYKY